MEILTLTRANNQNDYDDSYRASTVNRYGTFHVISSTK